MAGETTKEIKECIAVNREVNNVEVPNEAPACADGEGASDEDLFKEPPPREECPICFVPQPLDEGETTYFSCCGKTICSGCVHAHRTADVRCLCPFCRAPAQSSDEEYIERAKKRAEGDDVAAIFYLAGYYRGGRYGLQQNFAKANKLWLRAGELGDARGYNNVGYAYDNGDGVERDVKKAKYYWELAVMGGDVVARHNLGCVEENADNMDRAVRHWMISAAAGHDNSLKEIRQGFLKGDVTKDDFEIALRAHKEAKDDMKSNQREAAALLNQTMLG